MSLCSIDKNFADQEVRNLVVDILSKYADVKWHYDRGVYKVDIEEGSQDKRAAIISDIEQLNSSLIKEEIHYPIKNISEGGSSTLQYVVAVDNHLLNIINSLNYFDLYNKYYDANKDILLSDKERQVVDRHNARVEEIRNRHTQILTALAERAKRAEEQLNADLAKIDGEIALLSARMAKVDSEEEAIHIEQQIQGLSDRRDTLLAIYESDRLNDEAVTDAEMDYQEASILAEGNIEGEEEEVESSLELQNKDKVRRATTTYKNQLSRQLKALEREAVKLRMQLIANPNDKVAKEKLAGNEAYYNKLISIEKEVGSKHANIFSALTKEIEAVKDLIINSKDVNYVFSRLDTLYKLIEGRGLDGEAISNEEFHHLGQVDSQYLVVVKANLQAVSHLFTERMRHIVAANLRKNIAFRNFAKINNIDLDNIDAMFAFLSAQGDANAFDKLFLGVGFSSSGNPGLLPQLLKSQFEQVRILNEQEANEHKARLKEAAAKIKGGDFTFAFEKDSQGRNTGYIANIFRSSWIRLLDSMKLGDDMRGSMENKISFINDNGHVVDYAKIPAIKEAFGVMLQDVFTYSEEEMQAYEKRLKEYLGPDFDTFIDNAKGKIQSFIASINVNTDIAKLTHSPFHTAAIFHKRGKGGISSLQYNIILPKKRKFYNEAYRGLSGDKLAYVKELHRIYSNYVSTHIQDYEHMSYGKIALDLVASFMSGEKRSYLSMAFSYAKGMFFNTQNASKSDEAMPAYVDMQRAVKRRMFQILMNRSTEEILAYAKEHNIKVDVYAGKEHIIEELSNALSIGQYHTDINAVTATMIDLAASTATRTEMLPIAQSYVLHHRRMNPNAKVSYAKMVDFLNQIVKGLRPKDVAIFGMNKAFSDIDVNKVNSFDDLKPLLKEKTFMKHLDNIDKHMLSIIRQFTDIDLMTKPIKFTYNNIEYTSTYHRQLGMRFSYSYGGRTTISGSNTLKYEQFEAAYTKYIVKMINDTGVNATMSSILRGVNSIAVFKALGASPAGGMLNRWQGMNDNSIADATGQYWTSGNLDNASRFLSFINLLSMGRKIFRRDERKKFKVLREMIRRMGVLQEHTSAFDKNRSTSTTSFSLSKVLLDWAIDKPEFKNQAEIFLSILGDTTIKDKSGKEHKFFTSEGFTAYDITQGDALKLKDEFRTADNITMWEKFGVTDNGDNQMLLFMQRHAHAISHIQGNYDRNDTTTTTNNILYQMLTLFKKFMFSQFLQKYNTNTGHNLHTGKRNVEGRLITAVKRPAAGITYALGSIGMTMGMPVVGPALGIGAGVGLALSIYRHYFAKGAKKTLQLNAHSVLEITGILTNTIAAAINIPLRLAHIKTINPQFIDKFGFAKLKTVMDNEGKRAISDEDIANLRAIAQDLGNRLGYMSIAVGTLALLYDKDDDRFSKRRRFFNYMSNRLGSLAYDANAWLSPQTQLHNFFSIPNIGYLTKVYNAATTLAGFSESMTDEQKMDTYIKAVPLPNSILGLFKGYPLGDDRDFYSNTAMSRSAKTIATGGEYAAQKDYNLMRRNFGQQLINKGYHNPSERASIINRLIGKKHKDASYITTLEEATSKAEAAAKAISNLPYKDEE